MRKSEQRVYAAILDLLVERGRNPTTREVAAVCEISQPVAFRVVCSLRRLGKLKGRPDDKRGLEIQSPYADLGRLCVRLLAAVERGDDPDVVRGRYGVSADLLKCLLNGMP